VRGELRSLSRPAAESVARHLVAAGQLIDDDPEQALAHAIAARRQASRIAVVREAVGLAAYRAGDWQTAIAELRTYHRMSGLRTHLAVLADCERALGRPARAIDIYRSVEPGELPPAEMIELLIVAAGARGDLGQRDAAAAMLQVQELDSAEPWVARLRYAYADALLAAGREAEAREWFARAAAADDDVETDAAERLLVLDGVVLDLAEPDQDEPAEAEDELEQAAAEPAEDELDAEGPDGDEAQVAVAPAVTAAGQLVDPYDLVILDLDGVIYLGEEPIPGAAGAVERLREASVPVRFATNNASRGADEVAALLTRLGIAATADDVVTSAAIAADALADRLPAGSPVLVVGSDALAAEVRRVGLSPVADADARPAAVVQGYAPHVGWTQLAEACLAIRAGAQWVVTNTDATLPSPRGDLPGNGSLVAVLRTALERDPDLVVGKPHPAFFTGAAARAGASRPLVVGDRLDTDIEGAILAGLDSLLVLTGVSSAAQARAMAPQRRPTYLGADLGALFEPAVTTASGA
jgi:glycerol-1-phosphatase